jgi:hypothetical protein
MVHLKATKGDYPKGIVRRKRPRRTGRLTDRTDSCLTDRTDCCLTDRTHCLKEVNSSLGSSLSGVP